MSSVDSELLVRLKWDTLYIITEGKYWNQLKKIRKFRDVLSSGSHETGSTAKKVTASDSAKPGPHIHIIFSGQGSRVRVCMLASISPYTQRKKFSTDREKVFTGY